MAVPLRSFEGEFKLAVIFPALPGGSESGALPENLAERRKAGLVARLRVCGGRPRIGIKRLGLSGSRLRLSGIGLSGPRFENVDAPNY
jgi:hypothetical protein